MMGDAPSSFSCVFYSARYLWRVAGETKVALSVLKSSRSFKKKPSSSRTPKVEDKKDGYWDLDNNLDKDYFSVTPTATKRKSSSWRRKSSCHLCKIKYKRIDSIESPIPPETLEPSKIDSQNLKYLPITRTQPPKPPVRTSSLPFFKRLRRMALTTNPSAPLPLIRFSRRDGTYFQWLVLIHADKHGLHEFMDPIWDLLLQICHVEPCVRHLVLGVAALRQNIQYDSNSSESASATNKRHIIRHYTLASRDLHNRLTGIRSGANALTWEISFVLSYLLTVLQLALRNTNGAHFWMKAGYGILKQAFCAFGEEVHGRTLPASMRDVARTFGRLDTRKTRELKVE